MRRLEPGTGGERYSNRVPRGVQRGFPRPRLKAWHETRSTIAAFAPPELRKALFEGHGQLELVLDDVRVGEILDVVAETVQDIENAVEQQARRRAPSTARASRDQPAAARAARRLLPDAYTAHSARAHGARTHARHLSRARSSIWDAPGAAGNTDGLVVVRVEAIPSFSRPDELCVRRL